MAAEVPLARRGRLVHAAASFGASREGVDLRRFGPSVPGTPLVFAAIHGNEPETTVALSAALRTVAPADLRCAVVLALNPDGLLRGTRGNAAGVDLNRNFAASDWERRTVVHRWSSCTRQVVELETGDAPASEPEAAALAALVERLAPAFTLAVHAPIGAVLEPRPGALGEALAAATGLHRAGRVGYAVPGSFDTWATERGVAATTLELPRVTGDDAVRTYAPVLAAVLRRELA